MNALQAKLEAFWQARLPREQRILLVGGVLFVLVLWIGVLILPLQSKVERLDHELPDLRETNASLQAMAGEAEALNSAPASTPLPPAEREAALRNSLSRAGLGDPKTIEITTQDTAHIRVHCDDTDYGQWLVWLHTSRDQLGATIQSITVTARPSNGITGRVHADVVFGFKAASAT
jgi:type II secretory pathway component PulM